MRPDTRFHPRAIQAALRGFWRAVRKRDELERDLQDELRFHLDMEMEKNLAAGMTAIEARRAAHVALGHVTRITEAQRAARGTRVLDDLVGDIRYASRSLARAPAFVAVAVLTLAIAIAIGSTLFTGANSFFYRPLPVPGGADLIAVFTSDYNGRERFGASSYADITDFAREAAPIAEIAGRARVMFAVGLSDNSVMAQGAIVSRGYFRLLRVTPALGALPGDGATDVPSVVLSFTLWRRTFGADSALVGRQVYLNGQPFTVVAIASPEFRGTSRETADDFWIDGAFAPLVEPRENIARDRGGRRFHVVARLREGASLAALNARLAIVAAGLHDTDPDTWRDVNGNGRTVTAMRERDAHIAMIPRREVLLVVGGVAALGFGLLAIASANLASRQLARGASRRREIATRLALGASRGRLVRQLLAECALVVIPGSALGVAMAVAVSALVSHYRPIPLPSIDLALDWRALAFIGGGLLMAMLVFGLMPALQTVKADLASDLKGGAQAGARGLHVGSLRGGLIIAQVALSIVLTSASSIVALALVRDAGRGRGDAREVLIARVNFLPAAGDSAAVRALAEQIVADIATIPGVVGASAADFITVRGRRRTVSAELRDERGETTTFVLDANGTAPGYFGVVGLPVLRGRDFGTHDATAAEPVIIVSRAMADALWPSEDPIGKRLVIGTQTRTAPAQVIGVVGDPDGQGPATAQSFPGLLYLPTAPIAGAELMLHIRARGSHSAIATELVRRLRAESRALVASDVMTLDAYYNRMALPQRILAQSAGAIGALQLLLAVAGLSGLVAYVTALRRREVGIRTALGATRRSVLGLVMRQGTKLTVIGAAIGGALSLATGRLVALSIPVTPAIVLGALLLATGVFALTAAIAMWLPARRALDIAPAIALRLD